MDEHLDEWIMDEKSCLPSSWILMQEQTLCSASNPSHMKYTKVESYLDTPGSSYGLDACLAQWYHNILAWQRFKPVTFQFQSPLLHSCPMIHWDGWTIGSMKWWTFRFSLALFHTTETNKGVFFTWCSWFHSLDPIKKLKIKKQEAPSPVSNTSFSDLGIFCSIMAEFMQWDAVKHFHSGRRVTDCNRRGQFCCFRLSLIKYWFLQKFGACSVCLSHPTCFGGNTGRNLGMSQ